MTALPASTAFTDSAVTEGGFKTAISDQRGFLAGLLGTDGTIATGQSTLKTLCGAANARSAGSYSLLATDRGKVIHVTGSGASAFTVPTTATADFGVGWACAIRNDCSSGDITLTRSSTDTIDGGTSVVLSPGQSSILAITAAGKWVTIGKGATSATESAAGIVELATTAEAAAGTDTARAVTPAGVQAAKQLSAHYGQATTNGTTVKEITGIPSWASRITIVGSSLSGTYSNTSPFYVELGDSGGFETDTAGSGSISYNAANVVIGTLVKVPGTNTWLKTTPWSEAGTPASDAFTTIQTTSTTTDRVRLRLANGNWDAGTLTAYWE
jgi:hypothetical protein